MELASWTANRRTRSRGAFVNPTLTTPFVILTASAVAATSISVGSNSALTIGLSYALLGAVALLLIQRAKGYATYGGQLGGAVIYSANGLLSQPEESTTQGSHGINLALIRDVSGAAAFFTGLAAITLEGISFGDQAYLQVVGHLPRGDVSPLRVALLNILYPAVMVVVHAAMDSALLLTVSAFLYFAMIDYIGWGDRRSSATFGGCSSCGCLRLKPRHSNFSTRRLDGFARVCTDASHFFRYNIWARFRRLSSRSLLLFARNSLLISHLAACGLRHYVLRLLGFSSMIKQRVRPASEPECEPADC